MTSPTALTKLAASLTTRLKDRSKFAEGFLGGKVQNRIEHTVSDPSGDDRHPIAIASEWVSRITTVVIMMILPGLFGQWLDKYWGTHFLALVGFALGLPTSIWYLLRITKEIEKQDDQNKK